MTISINISLLGYHNTANYTITFYCWDIITLLTVVCGRVRLILINSAFTRFEENFQLVHAHSMTLFIHLYCLSFVIIQHPVLLKVIAELFLELSEEDTAQIFRSRYQYKYTTPII